MKVICFVFVYLESKGALSNSSFLLTSKRLLNSKLLKLPIKIPSLEQPQRLLGKFIQILLLQPQLLIIQILRVLNYRSHIRIETARVKQT